MTIFSKALLAAGVALAATAAPAAAQVAGIATVDRSSVIASTKAFGAANQKINTDFAANFAQTTQKQQQRQTLLAQLDTNGDKQVDDAELQAANAAKNPVVGQLDTLDQEINQLNQPAVLAQAFAIENLLRQYAAAQEKVVTARKINVILTPEAFIYAPQSVNITPLVTAELDKAVPTTSTTPPADWRPGRAVLQTQQEIAEMQQIAFLRQAILQQQQQQQQAAQAGQPGQPAQPVAPTQPQPGQPGRNN